MSRQQSQLCALVLCVALAGCAAAPDLEAQARDPEIEAAIAEADGTGGATGVAVPVVRWLALAILQMLQNVKINMDVKIDATDKTQAK